MSAEKTPPSDDLSELAPMDHSSVEKDHVIDRYLMGRLSADEEERFVEHYLSCPECLHALERAEKMQRAIKHQAVEDTQLESTNGKLLPFPITSRASIWTLAALLILAILPAGLMQRQISDLRSELAATGNAQSNVVLATLGAERSSGGGPTQVVKLSAEPQWIVFSLELDLLEHELYRATLLDQDDRELWTSQNLLPTASDTLTLGLHATTLSPGVYTIQVNGLGADGTSTFVSRFSFQAVEN